MIRTIVIDEEPSSVDILSLLLKNKCRDYIDVLAVSQSSLEGKSLVEQHQPDLVFLNVEMPELSGIDLVRTFTAPSFDVISITVYEACSSGSFRLCTVDYLPKPVEANDLVRVVERVRRELRHHQSYSHLSLNRVQNLLQAHSPSDRKIAIGMADKIVFVKIVDIVHCEANGAYTCVYLNNGKKIVASKTIGDFERYLNPFWFFRIHHSTLINLSYIREFQRFDGGCVIMDNGTILEVSQRKRKDFLEAIHDFIV